MKIAQFLRFAASTATLLVGTTLGGHTQQDICTAFRKTSDGMWTPLQPVTLRSPSGGAIPISPGMSFRPGVPFMGLDLASELNKNCKGRSLGYN
jgi:hypothetical protein